ncbi:MAG TPA: hypothetical protein VIP11_04420 [Gemmatimonadaceae bacterium]
MSAPAGPASISLLQLPSPSVVVGDSMRDSNGVVRPIRVVAFDASGIPTDDVLMEFFIVSDTIGIAHLTPSNVLVGDKVGVARLIGQVKSMQTPFVDLIVTHLPAKLQTGPKPNPSRDTLVAPLGADSATSNASVTVTAVVRSVQDSASRGIIVRYALVGHVPGTRQGAPGPAVFIAGDDGKRSTADTTDPAGLVSRRLTVVSAFLADTALVRGNSVDSATVEMTASYRGVPLTGSPFRIVVPIVVRLEAP